MTKPGKDHRTDRRQIVTSTTTWGIALCALGGLGLFLPWHPGAALDPLRTGLVNSAWQGGVIGSLLLLVLLHLVATQPLHPRPFWRPLATGLGAAAALVPFHLHAYGSGVNWPRSAGGWVTLLAILGLLVVAAIEFRGLCRNPNRSA